MCTNYAQVFLSAFVSYKLRFFTLALCHNDIPLGVPDRTSYPLDCSLSDNLKCIEVMA